MHFWQIHTNYLAGCSPFFHAGGNFPLVAGGRWQGSERDDEELLPKLACVCSHGK